MTDLTVFAYGSMASAGIEIVSVYKYYFLPGPMPKKYKQVGFWFLRAVIAIIAGFVAMAHHPETEILAIHLGASAPLLLTTMSLTLPK